VLTISLPKAAECVRCYDIQPGRFLPRIPVHADRTRREFLAHSLAEFNIVRSSVGGDLGRNRVWQCRWLPSPPMRPSFALFLQRQPGSIVGRAVATAYQRPARGSVESRDGTTAFTPSAHPLCANALRWDHSSREREGPTAALGDWP